MSLLPARLQINDPMFPIGEKVRPKEAEPAPCPYAALEGKHEINQQRAQPTLREAEADAFEVWLSDACPSGDVKEVQRQWEASAAYEEFVESTQPVADPDGWTPHDGGPCPVDGGAKVVVRCGNGQECPAVIAKAITWEDGHLHKSQRITHYKLATPPEAPKESTGDWRSPERVLERQQQRQQSGLPVEWDKVPVGSNVWVKGGGNPWRAERFSRRAMAGACPFYVVTASHRPPACWSECKLHIEGVAP